MELKVKEKKGRKGKQKKKDGVEEEDWRGKRERKREKTRG